MVDEVVEVAVLVNVPMQVLLQMYVVQNIMYTSVLPSNDKAVDVVAKQNVLEVFS